MKRRYQALCAGLGVVAMTGIMATPAAADPSNAKKGETLTLECDALGTLDIVVNGNGLWSPGHVVGSNQVLVPYAFHFEFTPPDGPTEVEDVSKPAPRNRRHDRCTFGGTDENGTFRGIVWVSYTRAR